MDLARSHGLTSVKGATNNMEGNETETTIKQPLSFHASLEVKQFEKHLAQICGCSAVWDSWNDRNRQFDMGFWVGCVG